MRFKVVTISGISVLLWMSGALLFLAPGNAGASTKGDLEASTEARSYLSMEAFSLGSLISQLKFEGYSTAEATYGAEHAGANWNAEAVLSSKQYLGTQAFSEAPQQK